jgi:hypothetical protein
MINLIGGREGSWVVLEAVMVVDADGEDGGGELLLLVLARRPMRLASSSSITVCGRRALMVERTRMALSLLMCAVPII